MKIKLSDQQEEKLIFFIIMLITTILLALLLFFLTKIILTNYWGDKTNKETNLITQEFNAQKAELIKTRDALK